MDLSEMIDKLAKAAEKTNGSLSHRDEKLFGRLTVIANKCQDLTQSDEQVLEELKQNNPSLITKINQFFMEGPNIVLLPFLQWNYGDKPDFTKEGFYIDYDLIEKAHPPLRNRMFYGLHQIASQIIKGVPVSSNYTIKCENFQSMLGELYNMTTEDVIDINQLNYEWLLKDAKEELHKFVQTFKLEEHGMTEAVQTNVCPQADGRLKTCFDQQIEAANKTFYIRCTEEAYRLFAPGYADLIMYLGKFNNMLYSGNYTLFR